MYDYVYITKNNFEKLRNIRNITLIFYLILDDTRLIIFRLRNDIKDKFIIYKE